MGDVRCRICPYSAPARAAEVGVARGNTERFRTKTFRLWRCPRCHTLHSIDPVDFADIYSDYPLNRRKLDVFARGTMKNLLRRLVALGLKKTDRVLDYGCGNGVFVEYLKDAGFRSVRGYDPFVTSFAELPEGPFDCIVANDVIEHCDDPRAMLRATAALLAPGGLLYVGTADAGGVDPGALDRHLMRLHQPFHRVIVTKPTLRALGLETSLELVGAYERSYMDTWRPFANYRFLDEVNGALGHNVDRALGPEASRLVMRRPDLMFYGLFGYLAPSAHEPAMALRRPYTDT